MFTTVFEIKLYYMIYLYEGWLKTIESLKYSVFLLHTVVASFHSSLNFADIFNRGDRHRYTGHTIF